MNKHLAPIPFVKMSGAGNDFVIIDHREPVIPPEKMADFARHFCRRRFSVGADGLFLIEESEQADFKWQFFNADGSVAEMCGNGARCVARFAYMHGIAPASMRFETLAGIVEAKVADTEVTIRMPQPHSLALSRKLTLENDALLEVHSLDTGVPHAVTFVSDLVAVDVQGVGSWIRHHPDFQPAGTNVNFVACSDKEIHVRTYERGVEGETMACGTGAVAGAIIAALLGRAGSPVVVVTAGNDRLRISFDLKDEQVIENVLLRGPAHVIYTGELVPEALADWSHQVG